MTKVNSLIKIITLLIPIVGSFAHAKSKIVISDIDDTIKLSHVPSLSHALVRALDVNSAFYGFSEVYQQVKSNSNDIEFYYVSKAPKILMQEAHRSFLVNNNFPKGYYLGYGAKTLPSNHKVESIRKILKTENPKEVLLIGDNGEQDSEVYYAIMSEFPGIQFTTLIHRVFSLAPKIDSDYKGHHIYSNQTPFLTSVELALHLNRTGWINKTQTQDLIADLTPGIIAEVPYQKSGDLSFPSFLRCSDYNWLLIGDGLDQSELLSKLSQKLQEVCR